MGKEKGRVLSDTGEHPAPRYETHKALCPAVQTTNITFVDYLWVFVKSSSHS
jgi:hypothetical protein